ncbi:hypothetical protein WJX72_005236 [[Myrmecia] bisecta]|uniref:Centrosomal protein of 44 kDa n=1 Tax=[Myrmecia] bisecta TaxID=41462 RepID=A0AAW1PKJ5_9CHLO
MATGDLAGNLERLRVELKHIKYTGDLDIAGIRLGDPVALLPLLNYVLVKFSRHVAQAIVSNGYELHGKTDARFVECAFKVMRELFNLRPVLTPAQFLEQGFAERKVLLLSSLIQYCKTEHTAAVRKVRLAAAVPPKLTSPQSSRKGNAAPPASAKSGRLKPSKLQFMAHNETPVLVVTRHSQQPSTSRHSSPIKLQQDASPSVSQRTQHSTATSSKPVPADRTGTDTIQQRTSGVDKQPYTAGSTRHQQPVREVDIPMEPFHPAHPAASQPSRTPATVDESPVALGSAVPPPQPPAAQPQHAQPSDLRVEEPGQACTAQTAAEAQPEYSADLEVGELARLVASLQERVAAAEMEADASRRESAAVQETLQARVTLLEGRVRFLEGRLEAHLAPAEAMQPASRAAPPEQPPGFRPGQLEVPGAPDTPAAGTSPARIAQASYRSTHDLISSIQDRYQEAQRLLQSYAK